MSTKKPNTMTANVLTEEQQVLRNQVIEVELKARYWEAQWKVKHFTLQSSKLDEEYSAFLQAEREKEQKAREAYQEFVKKMQEQNDITPALSVVPSNPENELQQA